uniref:Replication protein n=1 Tax=uncultured prokaryote TaxID=198431 RepID=A0A0H5Q4U5_9ZZZZ|nr:hypothetical protein [uncultured prokaryote]
MLPEHKKKSFSLTDRFLEISAVRREAEANQPVGVPSHAVSDGATGPSSSSKNTDAAKASGPAQRAGKGAVEDPLGIYPKSVGRLDGSDTDKAQQNKEKSRVSARRELYADLKTAAMILRNDRPDKIHGVAKCRWVKIAGVVSLHLVETHGGGDLRASFRGVKVCGNVWGCPVCSARISQKRRLEANDALAWGRAVGAVPVMLTLTARHGRKDALADLLDRMKLAKQSWRTHRAYKRIAGRILGSITATEMTHGTSHGWHPHFHQILFIQAGDEAEALALVAPLGDAWRASLRGRGLDGAAAAFDAQGAGVAGAYVAKWGAGEELTLTGSKKGRKAGRSPRELLRLAGDGDVSARRLWLEYFRATSGRRRHQLVWSPGLKDAVGLNDISDEEAATEQAEADEVEALAEWDGAGWRRIRPKRVRLLEAAERGGREAVREAEHGPDDDSETSGEVIENETPTKAEDGLTAADISAAWDEVQESTQTASPAAAVLSFSGGQDSRRVEDDTSWNNGCKAVQGTDDASGLCVFGGHKKGLSPDGSRP